MWGLPDHVPASPLSDTAQKTTTADLAQIFEPIREELDAVEQEFVRHIQSRVALIPEMGRYIQKSGGKRRTDLGKAEEPAGKRRKAAA